MLTRSGSEAEAPSAGVLNIDVTAAVTQLREAVRGPVLSEPRQLRSYTRDFGGFVQRTPRIVVVATCEQDVLMTFRVARAHRLPVAVRGFGGSCNGQALSDGGILLANRLDAPAPITPADDGTVELTGRHRWQQVEAQLNPAGRAIPVLADYLPLSVGGTLSVGGYGVDSLHHGAQVDQVERLRIVSPDGEARWCSADEHPDLFRFALAGQGRLGVIEKAVLRTVPYRPYSAAFCYRHRSLSDLVASLAWLAEAGRDERPDFFKALGSRGRYVSIYGFYEEGLRQALGRRAPAAKAGPRPPTDTAAYRWVCPRYRVVRSLAVDAWIGLFRRRYQMWSDYILDYDGLTGFVRSLEQRVASGSFHGCLKAVYLLAIGRGPAAPRPLEAAAGINADLKFGIGLYCAVPRSDARALQAVPQAFHDCLLECVDLGGRPYLYGWHQLDRPTLDHIYGEDYGRLLELRREFDPDGLLGAGKLLT